MFFHTGMHACAHAVSLPQQIDGTECAVVKFQNDDELGSYHGVVTVRLLQFNCYVRCTNNITFITQHCEEWRTRRWPARPGGCSTMHIAPATGDL